MRSACRSFHYQNAALQVKKFPWQRLESHNENNFTWEDNLYIETDSNIFFDKELSWVIEMHMFWFKELSKNVVENSALGV